jgi:hypothetical protein
MRLETRDTMRWKKVAAIGIIIVLTSLNVWLLRFVPRRPRRPLTFDSADDISRALVSADWHIKIVVYDIDISITVTSETTLEMLSSFSFSTLYYTLQTPLLISHISYKITEVPSR